jgi:hypothetical protein
LTLQDIDIPIHEEEETLERGFFTPQKQSFCGDPVFASLLPTLPLPLIREGGQGDRLLNASLP